MAPGDEAEFLRRLVRRDEAAFSELVREHEAQVWRLVRRFVRSDEEAEDLTQEVFVAVFRAIESFRGDSKLSTWIFRIAMNVAKNRLKYLGRRHVSQHRAFEDEAHGGAGEVLRTLELAAPDAALEGRETEAALRRALAALDDEQRAVLVLRDMEGLSYEEIQAVTGLPEGTVKSRLFRARTAVAEALREGGVGAGVREAQGKKKP